MPEPAQTSTLVLPSTRYTIRGTDTALFSNHRGAKTAMTLALEQPSLISNIISVDNAPIDATLSRSFANYIRGMKHIEEAGATRQSEADKILAEYEPDIAIRQFLLGNLYRVSEAHKTDGAASTDHKHHTNTVKFRIPLDILAKNLDNMGDFPFRNPDERRFEKPALFIRGTHSKYVPDEAIPIIGRFFPRFELADIEAGHWLISEKPAEFVKCGSPSSFFLFTSPPLIYLLYKASSALMNIIYLKIRRSNAQKLTCSYP